MQNDKLCSIVILSYNQVEFTKNCLESIRRNTNMPYQIIIVDNNSNEETVQYLREQKDVLLIENKENKGFAGGCNQGMRIASGDYILLLNNDTIVTKGYLENMVKLLESDHDIGIVGPLTNNTIGKQKLQVNIPYENIDEIEAYGEKIAKSNSQAVRTIRLIGFCMLFKKEFTQEIGMFDENFKIGNYEDDDLCIRTLLANKKLFICNTSFVYHYKRASFDNNRLPFEEISLRNKLYLEDKWKNINWNHHSVTNNRMVDLIKQRKAKTILHLCCGVGCLGLDIRNSINDCYLVGAENHITRMEIAKRFYNEIYTWDDNLEFLKEVKIDSFDVIVVENALELAGIGILDKIIPYMKKDTIIIIRVFNKNHVSTIEKVICGSVWGRTISAVSDEFKYYYGKEIEDMLTGKYKLNIEECMEVKKELKNTQNEIYQQLKDYGNFETDGIIYNRIYIMRMK